MAARWPGPLLAVGAALLVTRGYASDDEGCADQVHVNRCCRRAMAEARLACLEFGNYIDGVDEEFCLGWPAAIATVCNNTCGRCQSMSNIIGSRCRAVLQNSGLATETEITDFCADSRDRFLNNRCYAACNVTDPLDAQCESDEGMKCMTDCGDYSECNCRDPYASVGMDDSTTCEGGTQLKFGSGPELCHDMPEKCRYDLQPEGSKCGLYKHCKSDFCLIKQITCETNNTCFNPGVCDKGVGICFFSDRPDGENCSDGMDWTTNDRCSLGTCQGDPNYCMKYNVTCEIGGPCETNGTCIPATGRCMQVPVADGTKCDDLRHHTVEDECKAGMCQGRVVDRCKDLAVTCVAKDTCHDVGVCEPKTGKCSNPAVANTLRKPCDDANPATYNDTCIDSVCIGSPYKTPRFQFLGEGDCVDRDGNTMSRYYGDVINEMDCQEVCANDVQCVAYSFGMPLCSIYGLVRNGPPSDRWAFQEGGRPPAFDIEKVAAFEPGIRGMLCRKKGDVGDNMKELGIEMVHPVELGKPLYVGGFMMACFIAFFSNYLLRTTLKLCCGCCCRRCRPGSSEDG